jgi:hypothetical protein
LAQNRRNDIQNNPHIASNLNTERNERNGGLLQAEKPILTLQISNSQNADINLNNQESSEIVGSQIDHSNFNELEDQNSYLDQ